MLLDKGTFITDGDGDPDTRGYSICVADEGVVTVTATPYPEVSEENLPDCWTLTGGDGDSNFVRTVDQTTTGGTTITCDANSSSKETTIYVVEVNFLSIDGGNEIPIPDGDGDPDTREFVIWTAADVNAVVMATPEPNIGEPCLPDGWSLTGGDVQDRLTTHIDKTEAAMTLVQCIAGASSRTLAVYIEDSDGDHDGDGVTNYNEVNGNTHYRKVDSDGDGLVDGDSGVVKIEHYIGGVDYDGDGYVDGEQTLGTNPNDVDSDNDNMDDGWEQRYGLAPLDSNDASKDLDSDGKTNLEEYNAGTNPIVYTTISVMAYDSDNAGQITKETVQDKDENNVAVTQYQYDELGRRWQQRRWADADGSDDTNDIIMLYSYDTRSNLEKSVRKGIGATNPDTNEPAYDLVTQNFYDSLGRLTDVNDPCGGNTHYIYYTGGQLFQITDPNGNTTTNEYDNAGRLEKITDAEDHYRVNYYDSLGRTIKQVAYDKNNQALMQTRSEYNGLGHPIRRAVMADADSTSVIDPNTDMVTDYTYDNADGDYPGLLVSQTIYYGGNPCKSATTAFEYDGLGRRTKITDPCDNQTLFTYDEVGRIIRRQQIDINPLDDPNLVITTDYYYDSLGRLHVQIEKPNNPDAEDDESWQQTDYYYNALGNRTQETKPNVVVTTYSYDALGQLTKKIADYGITGQINQKTEYGYDRLGHQILITGYADGSTKQTTTYAYDGLARITKVTYPDGNDIDFVYNPAGKVIQRTDQRAIVTTYTYDGTYSMLTKSATVDSNTTAETFTYDGLSRILTATKVVDSGTISETEFVYNDIGKITNTNETLFGSNTKSISYTYDQAALLTSTTYPNGTVINITPDWQGRINTVKRSTITIATYRYMGSRVAQRYYPAPDITYQPSYDNLGRITSADSSTSYAKFDYEYDPNTYNISKMTYDHRSGDPYTEFSYDNLDRLTTAEYGIDDSNEVFTIDDLGNRTRVNARDGNDVSYSVDNLTNRYNSITEPANVGHWKMDDDADNTTVVDSSGNGNDGEAQQNTEDLHTDGKINGALTFNGSSDYVDLDAHIGDYEDLSTGTLSVWIKKESTGNTGIFFSSSDGGDNYSSMYFAKMSDEKIKIRISQNNTSKLYWNSDSNLPFGWHHFAYTTDSSGHCAYLDGVALTGFYTVGSPSTSAFFSHIPDQDTMRIGNLHKTDNDYFHWDGAIDDVRIYDRALTEEEITTLYHSASLNYDAAGNLIKDKDGYQYYYDYENRIVKIIQDNNDIAEFSYDALGRRIRKIDSVAGETTLYYHNYNWQVLCEYDGSDNLQRGFIYGNYIDEVLHVFGIGPASRKFYVHDHLYSPVALTGWWGDVQERYEYDAYGNCTILEPNFAPDPDQQSDDGNPYLFAGRRVDILDNGSLKIQYNRNRYYDYYTGRWLTQDQLGYADGVNLYEYVNSNPVMWVDPYGLLLTPWITLAEGDFTVTVFDVTVVGPYTYIDLTGPLGCGPMWIDGRRICCERPRQWYLVETYKIWAELKVDATIYYKVEARWRIKFPPSLLPEDVKLTYGLSGLEPVLTAKWEITEVGVGCYDAETARQIEAEARRIRNRFMQELINFRDKDLERKLDTLRKTIDIIERIKEYLPWLKGLLK